MRTYTEKSIYIRDTRKINKEIDEIVQYAIKCFQDSESRVNLYLSGSLARQEPTVRIVQGEEKLNSDLDFVIISKENTELIMRIIEHIKDKFINYDCSFVVMNEEQLLTVNSFFARDLIHGMQRPLLKTFNEKELPQIEITKENYLETVITQLCCYILNPDMTENKCHNQYFKQSNYHYLKLIVECIKAINYKNSNVFGYNDLISVDCEILCSEDIKQCVKARELSNIDYLPKAKIDFFIENAFKVLFDDNKYIDKVMYMTQYEANDIKLFQYATIFFWKSLNDKSYLERMFGVIDSISFVRPFQDEVTNLTQKGVSLELEEVIIFMRKIRNVYVEHLHYQNTRETIFVDNICSIDRP